MDFISIGQVAKKTGFGIETIRFYERKGLIAEPPRKESGYRQYDNDTVKRLMFIKQAKTLGFSLAEIDELFALEIKPGVTSKEVKKLAQNKLEDIEVKLNMLKQIQRTLKKLITECDGQSSFNQCPIINAIKT